jgi:hypothetical protein
MSAESSMYVVAPGRSVMVDDGKGNRVIAKAGQQVNVAGWSEKQLEKSVQRGFLRRYLVGTDPAAPVTKPVAPVAEEKILSLGSDGGVSLIPASKVETIKADAGDEPETPEAVPSGNGPFNLNPEGLKDKSLDELRAMIVERDSRIEPADVPDVASAIALLASGFDPNPKSAARS